MKVFISWSGETSRQLGEALRDWLPKVLQSVKPYFTPNDIEKGARWSSEISSELQQSRVGIICLTKDNWQSPWIMFEAGALSKTFDSAHVCPVLFDLSRAELKGPLVQFQSAVFSYDEIKKLLCTINGLLEEHSLSETDLSEVFEMWWPKLQQSVGAILSKEHAELTASLRSDRDLLEEVLDLARMNSGQPQTPQLPNAEEIEKFVNDLVRVVSTDPQVRVFMETLFAIIEKRASKNVDGQREPTRVRMSGTHPRSTIVSGRKSADES